MREISQSKPGSRKLVGVINSVCGRSFAPLRMTRVRSAKWTADGV